MVRKTQAKSGNKHIALVRPEAASGQPDASPASNLTEEQLVAMPESDYMNDVQLAFFKARLLTMQAELSARVAGFVDDVHVHEFMPDVSDQATLEEEIWRDSRLREREIRMMDKIAHALERIRSKEYGYCEKTGDAIGLQRLLARPTASTAVQVKELDERREAGMADAR